MMRRLHLRYDVDKNQCVIRFGGVSGSPRPTKYHPAFIPMPTRKYDVASVISMLRRIKLHGRPRRIAPTTINGSAFRNITGNWCGVRHGRAMRAPTKQPPAYIKKYAVGHRSPTLRTDSTAHISLQNNVRRRTLTRLRSNIIPVEIRSKKNPLQM